jgi:hypothetical protein
LKLAVVLGGFGALSLIFVSRFQPLLGVGIGTTALVGAVMVAAATLGNAAKSRTRK